MKTKPVMSLLGLTLFASASALANTDSPNDVKFGVAVEGMCGINIVDGSGELGIGGVASEDHAQIKVVNNLGQETIDTEVTYVLAPELVDVEGFEESLIMTIGSESKHLTSWEQGPTPIESGRVLTVKQKTSFDEMDIPAMDRDDAITTTFTVLCDNSESTI